MTTSNPDVPQTRTDFCSGFPPATRPPRQVCGSVGGLHRVRGGHLAEALHSDPGPSGSDGFWLCSGALLRERLHEEEDVPTKETAPSPVPPSPPAAPAGVALRPLAEGGEPGPPLAATSLAPARREGPVTLTEPAPQLGTQTEDRLHLGGRCAAHPPPPGCALTPAGPALSLKPGALPKPPRLTPGAHSHVAGARPRHNTATVATTERARLKRARTLCFVQINFLIFFFPNLCNRFFSL